MKKARIMAIIGIIAGMGYLGRTVLINNIRQKDRQAQESLVEAVEAAGALKSIDDVNEDNTAAIKKILAQAPKETTDVEYEEYVPIDGIYSLGKVGGEYYLVEVATQTLSKLVDVSNARICYVRNEDNDTEFNGIFILKGDAWYLIDENMNVLADLEGIDVLEKAKFTIRSKEVLLNK